VRCPGCTLVFQHPQPDLGLLDAYYHDPEFTEALFGPLRDFTLKRAREKLRLLGRAGLLRPGLRVLDVGCSSGAWLEVAQEEGMEATGVEIGEATAAAARARGLDVRTGTLEQAYAGGLSERRFDLITFWDVLEHLPDPRNELELASSLLEADGVVAASLPNIGGWYPRVTYRLIARRTRTHVWEHPELPHLYDFSPKTARALLDRCGYRPLVVKTSSTPFAFYRGTSLSWDRLGRSASGRLLRLAFEGLRVVVYPPASLFGRGNALFIAADR
jgi:SAM-dependent methyltransferase